MRVLTNNELSCVSGGRKTGSERARERRCLRVVSRGGWDGADASSGLGKFRSSLGFGGAGVGALIGGARVIRQDQDCRDAVRLGHQRENIERARNGDVSREREFRKR